MSNSKIIKLTSAQARFIKKRFGHWSIQEQQRIIKDFVEVWAQHTETKITNQHLNEARKLIIWKFNRINFKLKEFLKSPITLKEFMTELLNRVEAGELDYLCSKRGIRNLIMSEVNDVYFYFFEQRAIDNLINWEDAPKENRPPRAVYHKYIEREMDVRLGNLY